MKTHSSTLLLHRSKEYTEPLEIFSPFNFMGSFSKGCKGVFFFNATWYVDVMSKMLALCLKLILLRVKGTMAIYKTRG